MAYFITCEFCESTIDIESKDKCPNCAASFSDNPEYLEYKRSTETDEIRRARQDKINEDKLKAEIEKNKSEAARQKAEERRKNAEAAKDYETSRSLSIINNLLYGWRGGLRSYFRRLWRSCSRILLYIAIAIIAYVLIRRYYF